MLVGGRDLIVGARLDPNFGHVVLVGGEDEKIEFVVQVFVDPLGQSADFGGADPVGDD